jgi:hypothetical protein
MRYSPSDILVPHLSSASLVLGYRCSSCNLIYVIPQPKDLADSKTDIPHNVIQRYAPEGKPSY